MTKPLLVFCLLHCSLAYRHAAKGEALFQNSAADSPHYDISRPAGSVLTVKHGANTSEERNDSERTNSSMLEQRHQEDNLASLPSAQCSGKGWGFLTVGILYNRKATVDNKIAAQHPNWSAKFTKFVGTIARSKLLQGTAGASYADVNEIIIHDSVPLIIKGIAAAHLELANTRHAQITPAEKGCPPKTGMVLLEFKVCGMLDEELFKCCNVFAGNSTSTVGGWGQSIASFVLGWGQKLVSTVKTGGFLGGKVISGLVDELPGQLMAGLQTAGVGNPNVKLWPSQMGQDMFQDLAESDQTDPQPAQPDCPSPDFGCMRN